MVEEPSAPLADQPLSNEQLAAALRETGDLLEIQGASPFRVRAYRRAAETVAAWQTPFWRLVEAEGPQGLTSLPTIGRSIAGALTQLVRGGKFPLLERLRGESSAPERLFTSVPDIGAKLAHRIYEHLGIETLGELQAAACDGRLARVPGMGEKRLRAVRESLAGRFRGRLSTTTVRGSESQPHVAVEELLDVDRQYRELAERGALPRIAPRRFNPTRAAWLPILHTERGPRHYTALFSNTARAHEFGATHDWVVIYRDDDDHGQWTVITSNFGRLRGKRIVRGREPDCAKWYQQSVGEVAAISSRGKRAKLEPSSDRRRRDVPKAAKPLRETSP